MIQVLPGPRASHQGWNRSCIRNPVLESFPEYKWWGQHQGAGVAAGGQGRWSLLALRWVVAIMTKPSLLRGITGWFDLEGTLKITSFHPFHQSTLLKALFNLALMVKANGLRLFLS